MHAVIHKIKRCWQALALLVAPARTEFASQRYTSASGQKRRSSRIPKDAIFNRATQLVWLPRIAGGDPTSVLDDRVKSIGREVEAKRAAAKQAWSEFDQLRQALSESDVDISDENSEPFKKAEEAHLAYASLADELSALEARRDRMWSLTAERGPGDDPTRQAAEHIKDGLRSVQSPGDRVVASEAYTKLKESGAFASSGTIGRVHLGEMMTREEFARDLNASVIVTDDGGDNTVRPFIEPQHRGLVEPRFRALMLLDLITVGTTDSDSIDFVKETGWTNNAAAVPEAQIDGPVPDPDAANTAGVKPQSALTYEKDSQPVQTLAHWVASTRKALADVARLRSTIDTRLRRGLSDVLEDQIVAGDGDGDNLLGILNTTGIQHQDLTAPLVESIHRAITKIRLAFFEPTAVGLNPLDWEEIRLMRDASGANANTGGYLFGPPSQVGATTIWGLVPAIGTQFPENNPLVGDYRTAELYIREGVQVLASDSHADFFVRNLVAILAEMRAGLIVPQPEAFCEVSA